jgi:hypothetical protein
MYVMTWRALSITPYLLPGRCQGSQAPQHAAEGEHVGTGAKPGARFRGDHLRGVEQAVAEPVGHGFAIVMVHPKLAAAAAATSAASAASAGTAGTASAAGSPLRSRAPRGVATRRVSHDPAQPKVRDFHPHVFRHQEVAAQGKNERKV